MGLFDELIKTVKEAVEEAKAQAEGRPPRPPGAPRPPVSMQPSPADEAYRRAMLARQAAAARPQPPAQPAALTSEQRMANLASDRKKADAQELADQARRARDVVARDTAGDERLRLLSSLRDPRSAREAIVLAEILGKPLALRPPRFH